MNVGHIDIEELLLGLMDNREPFFTLKLPAHGAGLLKTCLNM